MLNLVTSRRRISCNFLLTLTTIPLAVVFSQSPSPAEDKEPAPHVIFLWPNDGWPTSAC